MAKRKASNNIHNNNNTKPTYIFAIVFLILFCFVQICKNFNFAFFSYYYANFVDWLLSKFGWMFCWKCVKLNLVYRVSCSLQKTYLLFLKICKTALNKYNIEFCTMAETLKCIFSEKNTKNIAQKLGQQDGAHYKKFNIFIV